MILAAFNGHTETVSLLLRHESIDINVVDILIMKKFIKFESFFSIQLKYFNIYGI